MKKLLFLLISLPGFVFGTIGDSKEEFEKKYGKPTKVMSNGQLMLYKKDNVKYMAIFHENKSVIFEVDYGRKLKDKEVLDLASKSIPRSKIGLDSRRGLLER